MEGNATGEIPPTILSAQEFRLVDSGGECRARLYVDKEDNARLSMFDGQNKLERLSIGFDAVNDDVEKSPALQLYDKEGVLRAILHLDSDQDPGLALYDSRNDQARIALVAIENGSSHLWFSDPAGRKYVRMFTGDDADGTGFVFHEQGNRRVVLAMDEEATSFFFSDNSQAGNDTERLVLEASEGGEARIHLGSVAGQVGISIVLDANGVPSVEMSNAGSTATVVVSLPDTGVPNVILRNSAGEQRWPITAPKRDE
jgi:hypothetical protein